MANAFNLKIQHFYPNFELNYWLRFRNKTKDILFFYLDITSGY